MFFVVLAFYLQLPGSHFCISLGDGLVLNNDMFSY